MFENGAVTGQGDPSNPARTSLLGGFGREIDLSRLSTGSKRATKLIIGLYLAFKSNFWSHILRHSCSKSNFKFFFFFFKEKAYYPSSNLEHSS